jgi:NADH:ubiquinone oxidoreductase subunit D
MKSAAWLLAVFVLAPGCRTNSEAYDRLRVENELLREQVRIIRKNCSYYRDLELEAEDEDAPAE